MPRRIIAIKVNNEKELEQLIAQCLIDWEIIEKGRQEAKNDNGILLDNLLLDGPYSEKSIVGELTINIP